MDLNYSIGSGERPRGHALVYFEGSAGQLLATYVVVAPVAMDFAKYVPPMFAGRLPLGGLDVPAAFPIPPVPEAVEGLAWLRALAEARDDDLIDGGRIDQSQPDRLLMATAEIAQAYGASYRAYAETIRPEPESIAESVDVDSLLISMMSEQELLTELAKLTGQLRDAVVAGEAYQQRETIKAMERLARRLPEKYRAGDLIAAAALPGDRGQRLSELYLNRSYRMMREEYAGLEELERQIRELQEAEG